MYANIAGKKNTFSAISYSQVEHNTLPLNAAKVYFYTINLIGVFEQHYFVK